MDILLFVVLIVGGTALLSWPLGRYMHWTMDPAGPGARLFARVGGAAARAPQDWKQYLLALLAFNVPMFVVSFGIMALQQHLPLNPDGMKSIEGSLIFNTAARSPPTPTCSTTRANPR
jgi:K+-transporting ATPase ATPase A chain